jgi:cytochrome b
MSLKALWDLPTRIIHWSLAATVVLNLFILEEGEGLHEWVGYAAVGLVVFRLIWGFRGGLSSRFSFFPLHPRELRKFLRGFFSKSPPRYEAHNPVASYVYLTIWACLLGLGLTGWMMSLDAFWGEPWLEDLHGNISKALQVLIVFHFVGMITDSIRFKRKTWLSMIRGRRD